MKGMAISRIRKSWDRRGIFSPCKPWKTRSFPGIVSKRCLLQNCEEQTMLIDIGTLRKRDGKAWLQDWYESATGCKALTTYLLWWDKVIMLINSRGPIAIDCTHRVNNMPPTIEGSVGAMGVELLINCIKVRDLKTCSLFAGKAERLNDGKCHFRG